jgi:hypothetical protein
MVKDHRQETLKGGPAAKEILLEFLCSANGLRSRICDPLGPKSGPRWGRCGHSSPRSGRPDRCTNPRSAYKQTVASGRPSVVTASAADALVGLVAGDHGWVRVNWIWSVLTRSALKMPPPRGVTPGGAVSWLPVTTLSLNVSSGGPPPKSTLRSGEHVTAIGIGPRVDKQAGRSAPWDQHVHGRDPRP